MTEIRGPIQLPARREDIELHTLDGLTLVGELAEPLSSEPVATLVTLHPLPTAGGHYALSFPFTRWLFPLLLFFTGLHTYWLCDPGKADDRAEPEFWIWYAICVLGTVLCGFIPWWLRDNFEKRAMFAMAVVPIDPVAVRVAASLFGEPSAKDQKRCSTVDYPLVHFRQLR